jgi:hypothetical protein
MPERTERDELSAMIVEAGRKDWFARPWISADAILSAGYRRVSADPETVERVARAVFNRQAEEKTDVYAVYPGWLDQLWSDEPHDGRDEYRADARAAIAAIRGDES